MTRSRLSELVRYGAVSVAALALDLGLMHLLISGARWPVVAASAAGFTLGMVLAYLLSCHWAFRHHGHAPSYRGWLVFSAIGVAGLVLNSALVWLCTAAVGVAWPLAKLAAACGSFSFNFALRRSALFASVDRNPGSPR